MRLLAVTVDAMPDRSTKWAMDVDGRPPSEAGAFREITR
jgi:hypothetical protein